MVHRCLDCEGSRRLHTSEEDRVALQKVRRKSSVFGSGDEKNRRLSLGVGGTATIVPVAEAAEGADAKGRAEVDVVLKAPGEEGAGADESGSVKMGRC